MKILNNYNDYISDFKSKRLEVEHEKKKVEQCQTINNYTVDNYNNIGSTDDNSISSIENNASEDEYFFENESKES